MLRYTYIASLVKGRISLGQPIVLWECSIRTHFPSTGQRAVPSVAVKWLARGFIIQRVCFKSRPAMLTEVW